VTVQSQFPIRMLSVNKAADVGDVCRSTINNKMRAWDEAIKAGKTPPPGALKSLRWGHRRLIRDVWLAQSLGLDLTEFTEIGDAAEKLLKPKEPVS
jgi:hypothetical protein